MFIYKLAYRHQNNDVEGFVGNGFDKDAAKRNALRKIERKCDDIGHPYELKRVIENKDQLTADELKTVKQDWTLRQ